LQEAIIRTAHRVVVVMATVVMTGMPDDSGLSARSLPLEE
jgi:hypothetical protein